MVELCKMQLFLNLMGRLSKVQVTEILVVLMVQKGITVPELQKAYQEQRETREKELRDRGAIH